MQRLSSLWGLAETRALRTGCILLLASTVLVCVACATNPAEGEPLTESTSTPSAAELSSAATQPADTASPAPSPAPEPTSTPVVEVTPTPEPAPPPPPPPGEDLIALQTSMAQAIEEYWAPGDYAVAVTDLQTGETVGVNETRSQLSACIANLFVLFQTARDIEAGKYTANDVDWLVSTTTWNSDANAARELYGFVGDGDVTVGIVLVNSLIHDVLDLDDIILDHPPGFDDSIALDPNNWVSAESVNRALLAFWRGEVVGAEGRAYLLDHLATVKPGLNYLTAAVPEGMVSHKNGFLEADTGFVDNDAGIIRLTRGNTEYAYALTFLSQEVSSKYDDIVLGQQLGALAYEVMAARYP